MVANARPNSGHTRLGLFLLAGTFALGAALASVGWALRPGSPAPEQRSADGDALRPALEQLEQQLARLDRAGTRLDQLAPGKSLDALAGQIAQLRRDAPPGSAPARETLPRDTVICVLNSRKLEYDRLARPALLELFRRLPDRSSQRLGLAVALTSRAHTLVRLGERPTDPGAFSSSLKAPDHVSESPGEELAEQLGALYSDAATPRQRRLLLIASSDCPSPDAVAPGDDRAGGWKRLQQLGVRTDVLLLPASRDAPSTDLPPQLGERAQGWVLFCAARGGVVHLLPRLAQPDAMTRLLLDRLREITAPTDKPSPGE
ncbi:MAG: hypothetical protein U0840_12710 [Gemmataceae bacterium]